MLVVTERRKLRVLITALAAATAISACSSTNSDPSAGSRSDAIDTSSAPSADGPVPVPTGADGEPLTKEEIAVAVKEGKLPASALTAAEPAPGGDTAPAPGTGQSAGKPAGEAPAPAGAHTYTGRVGPGISKDKINIGITLFKIGDALKGFGTDADPGDTQAQAKAAVDYVNANGGIAGRKINPIYYTFDLTRPGLQEGQSEQEACAKWTQDNKIFFAIQITFARMSILDCLAKADVPALHDGLPITESLRAPYKKYYYTNSNVILDRMAVAQTRSFCERGFFAKGAKVGIIYYDDPHYKGVVDKSFVPAITECGVPRDRIVLQGAPRGGSDGASSYAARFKAEGVTNVMFLGEANAYPLFFMPAAEQQQYRPKYGLSTAQTPALFLQDIVPPEQLQNAIGMGWMPTADVDAGQDPGPITKTQTLCLDIQRKAGQDMSNRQAAFQAGLYCGGLLWLQQVMGTAPSLSSDGIASAAAGLGSTFTPAVTFGASFGASKVDAPVLYRDFAWKNGSNKAVYVSGNKRMK